MSIKPCAFCNEPNPRIWVNVDCYIQCKKCGASMSQECPNAIPRYQSVQTIHSWMKKNLIEKWNTRTSNDLFVKISKSKNLKTLLCDFMDWVLKEFGYCNIAVWLSGEENTFDLAAYMKYNIVGNSNTTDALKILIPETVKLKLLAVNDLKEKIKNKSLHGHCAISTSGLYLGEALCVVTVFRNAHSPFEDYEEKTLSKAADDLAQVITSLLGEDQEEEYEDDKIRDKEGEWWQNGDEPPHYDK